MLALRRLTPTAQRAFSTSAPKSMAKLSLIGRLADAPELTIASTGREYLKYTLATSSGPRDKSQTSWWNVACFSEGPTKEYVASLPKGTLLYFEGDAKMDSFQDAEGKTRRTLNLIHRQVEVLRRPQTDGEGASEAES